MILVTIVFSWAFSQDCVIGSPDRTELRQQFENEDLGDDDGFLKAFRTYKTLQQVPGFEHYNSRVNLHPSCIRTAMTRIPMVSARRKLCEGRSDVGRSIPAQQCFTQDMVDYVKWGFNQSVTCVNSLPTNVKNKVRLSHKGVFQVYNLESAFGFYLYSQNGLGVGQLTTAGASDFFTNSRFYFLLKEVRASLNPACAPFKEIAKRPILRNSAGQIRHCQFLSLSEGLGRNLLISALHLATKEWEVISLLYKFGYKRAEVPQEIIEQLTYIAYSRHGIISVIQVLANKPKFEGMTTDTFLKKYQDRYPYLRELRSRSTAFLKVYNRQWTTKANLGDYLNGLCESTSTASNIL